MIFLVGYTPEIEQTKNGHVYKVRGAYANVLETDPQDTLHQIFHARSMHREYFVILKLSALEGELFEIEEKTSQVSLLPPTQWSRKLHHLERGFSNPENDELQIRCRVHDGTIATLHPETARQLVIQQLHRGLFWPHKTRAAKREHLPPFNQGPSNLSNEKKKLVV